MKIDKIYRYMESPFRACLKAFVTVSVGDLLFAQFHVLFCLTGILTGAPLAVWIFHGMLGVGGV